MTNPSPTDYYKCWIAHDALQQAVRETSYRSVWKVLDCECCTEPHCWRQLKIFPVDEKLQGRLRWYDHVKIPSSLAGTDMSADEIRPLQAHFVGHHQRIEMILLCLQPSLHKIYDLLAPFRANLTTVPSHVAQEVIHECEYASNGWQAIGELVRGVAKMNRIQVSIVHIEVYVPREFLLISTS